MKQSFPSLDEYIVNVKTLKQTNASPQILECETVDGIILYIRWTGQEIVCLEKRLGIYICSGEPVLHRGMEILPLDQVPFYLEMYSKFKIKFR